MKTIKDIREGEVVRVHPHGGCTALMHGARDRHPAGERIYYSARDFGVEAFEVGQVIKVTTTQEFEIK